MEPQLGVGVRSRAGAITDQERIVEILSDLARSKVVLRGALNRAIEREEAVIEKLAGSEMILRTRNFSSESLRSERRLLLTAESSGRRFVFASRLRGGTGGTVRAFIPTCIELSERRDRDRQRPNGTNCPRHVVASVGSASEVLAAVADYSVDGLAIEGQFSDVSVAKGDVGTVRFVDGGLQGRQAFVRLQNMNDLPMRPGWQRLGLRMSAAPFGYPVGIHGPRGLPGQGGLRQWRTHAAMLSAGIRGAVPLARSRGTKEAPLETVEFMSPAGERIVGIVDEWGDASDFVAVVIPPAWGKTKETLLPLAATIVETFKSAKQPIAVLRFDGIRRRGESHNDPECERPGCEQHHFTFSQGVRDIRAALDFWQIRRGKRPRSTVLVTFSAASIEGRRATALEPARINGWISVVGAADLQSAMREVSGGVDYLAGAEQGLSFGVQEIQGVEVDMDRAAADALREGLAFMEDARVDMARVSAPVTWIHGQFDAWMDLERSRDLLSVQSAGARRLLVVPTGHQLRSSRQAMAVFQLIAAEIGQLALGRRLEGRVPDLYALQQRARRERARLKPARVDVKSFWNEYLLGRPGRIGIELMTASSAYTDFMNKQVTELRLSGGSQVVDLGSGTGAFAHALMREAMNDGVLRVTEVDFVVDALRRSRAVASRLARERSVPVVRVVADLGRTDAVIPLRDDSQDAVLASLLISYLSAPAMLLREARRVLRRGGRIVLSTLKVDADTSKIFREAAAELRRRHAEGADWEGVGRVEALDDSLRSFLNDAARLVEFEEQGLFRFWDRHELAELLTSAGFEDVRVLSAFGSPPQALIAVGVKR